MSERDEPMLPSGDDYLWDGQGDAPAEIAHLESLAGEARLRAPLSIAPRRPWPIALVAGGLVAVAVAAAAPPRLLPPGLVAALLPGVSSAGEVAGSSTIELEVVDHPVDEAARAALQRRLDWRRESAAVTVDDGHLVVEVTGVPPGEIRPWVEWMRRPGRLSLTRVVSGSSFMAALADRAAADPRAVALGVISDVDAWDFDDGTHHEDRFLRSRDRDALQGYVRDAVRQDPSLAIPAGVQMVEEHRPASDDWRTYLVVETPAVEHRHLDDVAMYWNQTTGDPELLLVFDREGAERFALLTERLRGQKLAILVDRTVIAAPVVQDRIIGGRTSITFGAAVTAEARKREALDLLNTLRTPPLPFQANVHDVRHRPGLPGALLQVARLLLSLLVGLVFAGVVGVLERRAGRVDPDVSTGRGRAAPGSAGRRLLVTAAGLASTMLLLLVPLPGTADLRELLGPGAITRLSPFALGISPIMSAYLVVEVVALLVPRWRRLRHGGPGARARLSTATLVLSVLFAALQAFFMISWLANTEFARASMDPQLLPGVAGFWGVVALLVGGTLILSILALLIDKGGLVNGFACVTVGGALLAAVFELLYPVEGPPGTLVGRLATIVGVALAVAATSAILRWRPRSSGALPIRMPTAGYIPNGAVVSIGAALTLLAMWPGAHVDRVQAGWGALWAHPIGAAALLLVVALGLSWLFSRPRPGSVAAVVDPPARRRMWATFARAAALSSLYVLALFAIQLGLERWAILSVAATSVAMATATFLDGLAEWRAFRRRGDLIPIWPLHQIQAVDRVLDALAREGIDVHARSLHLRSLLHFFGPYAPVVLFVPADRRHDALAILRAQAGSPPPAPSDPMRGASQAR